MEYKLKDKTNKDCPKCNSKLYNKIIVELGKKQIKEANLSANQLKFFISKFKKYLKEINYLYVCLDCNENFYNFETEKEL
jgi:DNA-directed RNA polymerase subunit RPC12/RpoP